MYMHVKYADGVDWTLARPVRIGIYGVSWPLHWTKCVMILFYGMHSVLEK